MVVLDHWQVLGGVALVGNDSLQPPRHGLHQVLQVLAVIHLDAPELGDLPLQLLQVGGLGVPQLSLHPCPHFFNGVKIRAVAWKVNEGDAQPLLEPGCGESDWSATEAYSPFPLK